MLTNLLVLGLLFSCVAAVNKEHLKASSRAPWCSLGGGCVSLLLGPLDTAVEVPVRKCQWEAGSFEEVAVTLIVSLMVASLVSTCVVLTF